MFKSAVSAAFAAHSISAVFVALVIPRVRISAAFTAFAANANKGLRLRARLERRSLVTLLFTIGRDWSRVFNLSFDWQKVRSSGLISERLRGEDG